MDRFDTWAIQLLPCDHGGSPDALQDALHQIINCPYHLRPAVAQALREADREGAKRARREAGVIGEIDTERRRQITSEPWSDQHDDQHDVGELSEAAAAYCLASSDNVNVAEQAADLWPWDVDGFKPKDRRRDLIRAGAMIVAEIERMDRALAAKEEEAP